MTLANRKIDNPTVFRSFGSMLGAWEFLTSRQSTLRISFDNVIDVIALIDPYKIFESPKQPFDCGNIIVLPKDVADSGVSALRVRM